MTRDEAWALLTQYNQGEFHLRHARTLEGVMRYLSLIHILPDVRGGDLAGAAGKAGVRRV